VSFFEDLLSDFFSGFEATKTTKASTPRFSRGDFLIEIFMTVPFQCAFAHVARGIIQQASRHLARLVESVAIISTYHNEYVAGKQFCSLQVRI
jgi:hypothetical protein